MTQTTTTTTTLTELTATGITFDPIHDLTDPVPVLTGPQAQGDIYVLPTTLPSVNPRGGDGEPFAFVDVIEGQGIRNPHTLIDLDGRCRWVEGTAGYPFDVGTLHVPDGTACFLVHPEHGGNGIGPGSYVIRRQREMAEEIRAVAD